ncbi:UdgX family uracil-DNA binding protein [Loktanella sp. SALINAS62]|uniref:UdgX family uracil-DNA binding protein n=1 Tax=Loktanella sp. SALINAS62 TaxID=2706124 RepID=UPI001B8C1100|nr:UdgX family uracil-DNA binding protein [Loktanella sp. SALINAS62]MBS1300891.1 UdgX family uracil-DNA binding protein [Loktanella sp. SALINAS62]
MLTVPLPRIGTWDAWRDAARACIAARIPPEDILWNYDDGAGELFATALPPPIVRGTVKVPADFVDMARWVVWHSDPQRFARLYAMLWRLRLDKGVMADRADPDLAKLRQLEKAVHRCKHKMRAFVRFRDLRTGGPRRSFAAWFEPTHHTLEPNAPFFARRFADMDWMIVTPDVTADFKDGTLTFHPGQTKPDLPDDATEELWGTYFKNIFNPARLKVKAMTSEMPRKYWKNMPEAQHIPDMIANAEARVRDMAMAAPTLAPARVARIREQLQDTPQPASWNLLTAGLHDCTRCPLHGPATQVVPGTGPQNAPLMIVGEQPGDAEDLAGMPFVGPAGQLFDQLAQQAGLDRRQAYVTNAVKHFKYEQRGKRRIHQNPDTPEIEHCRFWVETEIRLVKPRLILAMGGTAAESLTGSRKDLLKRRGKVEDTPHGPVFLTVHPSYLLRLPSHLKPDAQDAFVNDLRAVVAKLAA